MVKRDSNFNEIRASRGVRRAGSSAADWGAADGDTLIRAVEAAAIVGGALRFGYSRDGGAYAIGIYGDGEPYTEFIRPAEDINAFLLDITQLFIDIRDGIGPNKDAPQSRKSPPQSN